MGAKVSSYFLPKKIKTILVGFDAAGKTTTLYQLAKEKGLENQNTPFMFYEEVKTEHFHLYSWDLGGNPKMYKVC